MDGIVFAITSDRDLQKLSICVKSLEKVSKLPILVYTPLKIPNMVCVNPANQQQDIQRTALQLRTGVHRITKFDRTLFLSPDCVVMRDPAWIFDEIPDSGFMFGSENRTLAGFGSIATPGEDFGNLSKSDFDVSLNLNWKLWNSGAYVFDSRGKIFLEDWHQNTLKMISLPKWSLQDQSSLAITAFENNIQDNKTLSRSAFHVYGTGDVSDQTVVRLNLVWGDPSISFWRKVEYMFGSHVVDKGSGLVLPDTTERSDKVKNIVKSLESVVGWQIQKERDIKYPCARIGEKIGIDKNYVVILVDGKVVLLDTRDDQDICKLDFGVVDLILKCQYRSGHESYRSLPIPVVPFLHYAHGLEIHSGLFRKTVESKSFKQLLFARFSGTNRKNKERFFKSIDADVKIGNKDENYVNNITSSKFFLDFPGSCDIADSLVDGLSLGMPVIRPKCKTEMYIPFCPGEHYIECNADGSDVMDLLEHYSRNYELSLRIARNGKKYYDNTLSSRGIASVFQKVIVKQFDVKFSTQQLRA
jgi:hypothetical protein